MWRILLIFIGGGTGASLRYLVGMAVQRWADSAFPLGIMVANVSGCFLIGLLASLFAGPKPVAEEWKFLLLTGVLGGYTTFSTFSWDTLMMAEQRQWTYAIVNVVASVAFGLIAVWLGRWCVVSFGSTS